MNTDPRQPDEIIKDHQRADQYAPPGTVMHFIMLRMGFYPYCEENAEDILISIIAKLNEYESLNDSKTH